MRSAALLAYANDALDTTVRSVRVQKENFWSVSENQPFSKHVILGGLMSGGRLSGGLKSGGRLSGGRLSGGLMSYDRSLAELYDSIKILCISP